MCNMIQEKLKANGFKTVYVKESAEDIIMAMGGKHELRTHLDSGQLTSLQFQCIIMRAQAQKERLYEDIASRIDSTQNMSIVMLFDRGICDSLAFASDDGDCLLKESDLNVDTLGTFREQNMPSFDMIIFMETCAAIRQNTESEYARALTFNQFRLQNSSEARGTDILLWELYKSHRNIFHVPTEASFDRKARRVMLRVMDEVINAASAQNMLLNS